MGALFGILCLAFVGVGLCSFLARSWTQRATPPVVRCAPNSAMLSVVRRSRKSEGGDGVQVVEQVSLAQLVESRCPSLYRPFKPVWWLPNGHLQTLYCCLDRSAKGDVVWYKRTYLRLCEGGTLGLDFAPPNHSELPDDTPIVVVQHGLTGGSTSPYVRAVLSRACASVENGGLGYRAVVINFRGCAGVPVTSPMLYSAGHTDDTRQALMYIAHKYPRAPLLGLGFSLGGNVLTRYLAEEGGESRLSAVCILGCPWDLKKNNENMLRSFVGTHVYSRALGGSLLRLLRSHLHSVMHDPEHYIAQAARAAAQLKYPRLDEFDAAFTRIAGGPRPQFPFADADAYYAGCSSHDVLDKIAVPLLSLNAADDPIVRDVPMDGGGNGLVVMVLTAGGGHVGWFEAGDKGVGRWSTQPVLEWLRLFGEDVVHQSLPLGRPTFTDSNGHIREEGREEYLGLSVLKEVDVLIDGSSSDISIIPVE